MSMHRCLAAASLAAAGVVVTILAVPLTAQPSPAPADALQSMAEAERAFARMALAKGIRDAFVEHFADDAIGFYPNATNAREFYRNQPQTPPSVRLEWEPRLGDVARSGELGWLTGPYSLTYTGTNRPARHGCYFSIWARRPNQPWKVLMDVGVQMPEPCRFPHEGLAAVEEPGGRFLAKAGEPPHGGGRVVMADQALGQSVERDGVVFAYRDALTSVSRVHLPGRAPLVGRDAILAWLSESQTSLKTTPEAGDLAASGELGFTRGTYEVGAGQSRPDPEKGEKGHYVRMWKRLATGQFAIAVEVRSPLE